MRPVPPGGVVQDCGANVHDGDHEPTNLMNVPGNYVACARAPRLEQASESK